MPFRPERGCRGAPLAAALALCALACGCGRANLTTGSAGTRARTAPSQPASPVPPPSHQHVPVPLPLDAARALTFARAVALHKADVTGSEPSAPSKSSPAEQREAASCSKRETAAVGGGRSPAYKRGVGLELESISSAVEVLKDAAAVKHDLEYVASKPGLSCYAHVLSRSLHRSQSADTRVFGFEVGHERLALGGGVYAGGLRVTARVGVAGARNGVRVYVDVMSLPYGPAELNLYSTSFLQPVASKTQAQLLKVMLDRARRHRL